MMKPFLKLFAILLAASLGCALIQLTEGSDAMILANQYLELRFDGQGHGLQRIVDLDNSASFDLTDNGVAFIVDGQRLACGPDALARVARDEDALKAEYEIGDFVVTVEHRLPCNARFFEKAISIQGEHGFQLLDVSAGQYVFAEPYINEVLEYSELHSCPYCVFLRTDGGGIFCGIENPFFETDADQDSIHLSFEPSIKIKPGETFVAENLFLGLYTNENRYFAKEVPDEFGWIPDRGGANWESMSNHLLDWGEVHAMQAFMEHYMPPRFERFERMMDGWWAQLPCLETGDDHPEDVEHVKQVIDNLTELDIHQMQITAFPIEEKVG